MPTAAASVFVLLAGAAGLFQLALIAGAPWGELTLGGRFPGRLPARVRVIPLASFIILAAFAAVIAARAGLAFPWLRDAADGLAWVVVAYCAVGTAANALTPSRRERALWLPVVVVMLLASALVALAPATHSGG